MKYYFVLFIKSYYMHANKVLIQMAFIFKSYIEMKNQWGHKILCL